MIRLFSLIVLAVLGLLTFRFFMMLALYQDGRPIQSNSIVKVIIAPFTDDGTGR